MRDQIFPVFNPHTWDIIGYKPRAAVHQNGDWHLGVQAYILHQNKRGGLEVLIQKRSQKVDISSGKFDQSLAVQMIKGDRNNPRVTLERGLFSELGLKLDTLKIVQILDSICLNIIKTYTYHKDVLNREQTKLYLILCEDKKAIVPDKNKIDDVLWVPWGEMFRWKRSDPDLFTKTARFYAVDPVLSTEIEHAVQSFVYNNVVPVDEGKRLPRKITYYSESNADHDVSIHYWPNRKRVVYLLDAKNNFAIENNIRAETAHIVETI